MKMKAAQALLRIIKEYGAETVFGYPGTAVAPIYNEIPAVGLKHILTCNEQAAAIAASSSYKTTGKAGVCIATSGPGATNLITGIANAYMDSLPLICITGQVSCSQIGTDAFQEVDTTGVTTPVSKHNYLIKDAAKLPETVREAIKVATTGRMGPVVIDIPFDVQNTEIDYEKKENNSKALPGPDIGKKIAAVKKAINKAKKPLIIAGGGVILSGSSKILNDYAKKAKIPVCVTMMGISAVPKESGYFLGMLGVHGTDAANKALKEADLVMFLGSRVSDRTVINPAELSERAAVIHVDIDPAEIDKNIITDISAVCDMKVFLKKLYDETPKSEAQLWTSFEEKGKKKRNENDYKYVNPKLFLEKLSCFADKDAYVATEVGLNQIWTANYYNFKTPSAFLTSGGFGTMGYGLPAAIGAKIFVPERSVFAVEGDGSLVMGMGNLATIKKYDLDIKIIVFSNNALGMVRKVQKQMYGGNYVAVDLSGYPDICRIADAYGIENSRIDSDGNTDEAIKKMITSKKAYLLDVLVDSDFGY